jgi:hypothetical protein
MAFLEQKNYTTQDGSRTTFVLSPISKKFEIEQFYQKLMAAKGISKEEFELWGERVSKAVEQSLVVHMTYAKL